MTIRSVEMYWSFDISSFGQAVTAARMDADLKMSELAVLVDMSQSNISRIERGMTHNPEINGILKICDVLNLDPRNFFEVKKLAE